MKEIVRLAAQAMLEAVWVGKTAWTAKEFCKEWDVYAARVKNNANAAARVLGYGVLWMGQELECNDVDVEEWEALARGDKGAYKRWKKRMKKGASA